MSAWPSRTSSPSPPASRGPARSPSPRPTASSPPAAPTTSSPSRCAHSSLNVKIVAGLPGLTTGYGGTHQAIEDLGADADDPRPHRHRPLRRDRDRGRRPRRSPTIAARSTCGSCAARCRWSSTRGYRFEIGKARLLRDGSDVGIISTGLMTERALDAADDARERAASRPACCTSRRSSRSTPTPSPPSRPRSTALVTAENHVVVGGLASLVVEALFDAGVAAAADPHRPAGPLHRMRLGADLQAKLRAHDRSDRSRRIAALALRRRCHEDHRRSRPSPSAPAGRTGSSCRSTPMPASTASARARSTASSRRPKPACTNSTHLAIGQDPRRINALVEAHARQRLARWRPHPSHGHRGGRGRLLGHPRQVARRADPSAARRAGARQRARLRQWLVPHRAHAGGLPRGRRER